MPLTRTQLDTWCESLRANPEKQLAGRLFTYDLTRACCLGELALCTNQTLTRMPHGAKHYGLPYETGINTGTLAGAIKQQFGSDDGLFRDLGMPNIGNFCSAASANDQGVPWPEIADHFQTYYKCCEDF